MQKKLFRFSSCSGVISIRKAPQQILGVQPPHPGARASLWPSSRHLFEAAPLLSPPFCRNQSVFFRTDFSGLHACLTGAPQCPAVPDTQMSLFLLINAHPGVLTPATSSGYGEIKFKNYFSVLKIIFTSLKNSNLENATSCSQFFFKIAQVPTLMQC